MSVENKDDYRLQRARVERLAEELAPGSVVEFDEGATPNWMRLRILFPDGTVLLTSSGHWHASEIADKTDKELQEMMKHLAGGLLGR